MLSLGLENEQTFTVFVAGMAHNIWHQLQMGAGAVALSPDLFLFCCWFYQINYIGAINRYPFHLWAGHIWSISLPLLLIFYQQLWRSFQLFVQFFLSSLLCFIRLVILYFSFIFDPLSMRSWCSVVRTVFGRPSISNSTEKYFSWPSKSIPIATLVWALLTIVLQQ
jgi:hypothetical protein